MGTHKDVRYVGLRSTKGEITVTKCVDDLMGLELPQRPDLGSPSPAGFDWGGFGDASAQLALALCADVLGEEHALAVYHCFKLAVISKIPLHGFCITAEAIDEWARELDTTHRVPPMPKKGLLVFEELPPAKTYDPPDEDEIPW